jgi:hypothetical protein
VTTPLTPAELQAVEIALSQPRLQPYIAARGTREKGIALYTLNIELCQALVPTLHVFEVTLRNSVHRALSGAFGSKWYVNGNLTLRPPEEKDVLKVLTRLSYGKRPRSPGRVVAELNLGFWTNLFDRHYEVAVWTPHRLSIFPYASAAGSIRADVHQDVKQIRDLRNRVFHYEPIWNEPSLVDAYGNAQRFIAWISPAATRWLSSFDDFPSVHAKLWPFRQVATYLGRRAALAVYVRVRGVELAQLHHRFSLTL